ncbi:UNVERIFIED_CONTAM: hypothetical protein RMT77_019570 [Armadillidium vulgare]
MLNFIFDKVLTTLCIVICLFSNKLLCSSDAVTNCSCGLKTIYQPKIAGGIKAEINEFPWQAALYFWKQLVCGGSIINNLYILTAAHCFIDFRREKIWSIDVAKLLVALGSHQREDFSKNKEMEEQSDIREIIQVIVHEKFDCPSFSNDIALMKMKEPLTRYSLKIIPICLPSSGRKFENISATISGWGRQHENRTLTKFLRKANVKILPNIRCYKRVGGIFSDDIMLCADSTHLRTCSGDSGGPLVFKNETDRYVQIGISSFGFGCSRTYFPHVYSRVSHYLPWIKNHTSDATYCEN